MIEIADLQVPCPRSYLLDLAATLFVVRELSWLKSGDRVHLPDLRISDVNHFSATPRLPLTQSLLVFV